uniref:Cyclin-dependent kinase 4 inhibitor D n=1 Tax=Callorhinchus milii TaxID=7868 RepID=A0A4W3H1T9_CALMI|eukprot:gi/632988277/ref/XP_007883020.1/ PREDICTED: cyclin-dependent kinase 4 inhibitor D-like [Callorhinchus milii]
MVKSDIRDGKRLSGAAARGDLTEVKRLLDQERVNVHTVNEFGKTALQVVMLGSSLVVEELLKHGARPDVQDQWGFALAHDVARCGFLDTLRVLTEHGANVNLPDAGGSLPIHLAAGEGHLDVVQHLAPISNVQHRNLKGQTPVEVARAADRTGVAMWLKCQLGTQSLH